MDRAQITDLVIEALETLVNEQPELLDLRVTERALSHHLACYIAALTPDELDVDIEYNRHGNLPKRLDLPPRIAVHDEIRATTVFPDIIVHERATDDNNLLVLELKKPGGDLEYDELKLHAFRDTLGYRHAGHVVLGLNQDQKVVRELIWIDEQST